MSPFTRLAMVLGGFTFGVTIYAVYEFVQTQNMVWLAIPAVLVPVSGAVIAGQRQGQEQS